MAVWRGAATDLSSEKRCVSSGVRGLTLENLPAKGTIQIKILGNMPSCPIMSLNCEVLDMSVTCYGHRCRYSLTLSFLTAL